MENETLPKQIGTSQISFTEAAQTPIPDSLIKIDAPEAPAILAAPVKLPTAKRQSWGVVISIVIIVLMIVIGAFYSWGKRIAEENALGIPPTVE